MTLEPCPPMKPQPDDRILANRSEPAYRTFGSDFPMQIVIAPILAGVYPPEALRLFFGTCPVICFVFVALATRPIEIGIDVFQIGTSIIPSARVMVVNTEIGFAPERML